MHDSSEKHEQNELAKKLVKVETMVVELQQEKINIKDIYKTQLQVFIDEMVSKQQETKRKLEQLEKNNAKILVSSFMISQINIKYEAHSKLPKVLV